MLYALIIVVHVIVCIILIAAILLQAGRGGGLSETFGSESSQTIFGAKASVFLTRATVVAACLYLVTCLALGIMTSRRGRSLIRLQGKKVLPVSKEDIPLAKPEKVPTVPKEDIPLAKPEKIPQ